MSELLSHFEKAGWPVLLVDSMGVIQQANTLAKRCFGAKLASEPAIFSSVYAIENPEPYARFFAQAIKNLASMQSVKLLGEAPTPLPFAVAMGEVVENGKRLILVQCFPSIAAPAENKSASVEINLAQKQKLDCALQLTRTVALDFNNALTSILGHTSYMLGLAEQNHPWRLSLMEVEKAASKAAEISNQLAIFSSEEKENKSRAAASLNDLTRRTVELFQTVQNAGISWTLQFEEKLYASKYDEAKIQQAIVKVLENAIQAVPPTGHVSISTRNLDLADATQDRTAQLAPGSYVVVEIVDDGCGIDGAVLPRVFEPFFTTKPGHRGLGLAWVYGIVTNHGGGVAISSLSGQGTSVRIYMPAVKSVVQDKPLPPKTAPERHSILVVDDEEMVRTMAQVILSSQGYRILCAPGGEKALEILANHSSGIDLLITDMVMPGMNGRELIERVRVQSPRTKILCSTGCHPANPVTQGLEMLAKPFTAQQLVRKVRECLG